MAINRQEIIDKMSQVKVEANEKGIIEGFNVLVQQLPADFWNNFADRLTSKMPEDLLESTEYLLYNAAHECGYHTGYGIMHSDEWAQICEPMLEEDTDALHAAFAVFTAWGWAKTEVVELVPGQKMVIRAYDYYESDVVKYGKSSRMKAFMISGVSAAFMDLAFGGPYDKTGKTGFNTFTCKQVKGIEAGDDYGEFVVTKI